MGSSRRFGVVHIQVQSHTPLFEQLFLHDEIKRKEGEGKMNEVEGRFRKKVVRVRGSY